MFLYPCRLVVMVSVRALVAPKTERKNPHVITRLSVASDVMSVGRWRVAATDAVQTLDRRHVLQPILARI